MPKSANPLSAAAEHLGEMGAGFLEDRLELLGLELQEARIRLAQVVLLICVTCAAGTAGLALLVGLLAWLAPPPLRIALLLTFASACLGVGILAFLRLRRQLAGGGHPLAATVAELKKDATCFSTKN